MQEQRDAPGSFTLHRCVNRLGESTQEESRASPSSSIIGRSFSLRIRRASRRTTRSSPARSSSFCPRVIDRGRAWCASMSPSGWRIASGLDDTAEPTVFMAPEYDTLVDQPTLMGEFDVTRNRLGLARIPGSSESIRTDTFRPSTRSPWKNPAQAEHQFSAGRSRRSITRMSCSGRDGSSLRPSCSRTAVNTDRAESGGATASGPLSVAERCQSKFILTA